MKTKINYKDMLWDIEQNIETFENIKDGVSEMLKQLKKTRRKVAKIDDDLQDEGFINF